MKRALVCFGIVFAVALALSADVLAGQFKRMGSGPGFTPVFAYSSPMTYGQAMEMEAYEFTSGTTTDNFRCAIIQNRTNRPLNLRFVGVNATVVGSCTAPVGGNCVTPVFSCLPNLKFWCVVATQYPAPVAVGGWYQMSVQRP